jgi:Protein of unknown function (DUF2510)
MTTSGCATSSAEPNRTTSCETRSKDRSLKPSRKPPRGSMSTGVRHLGSSASGTGYGLPYDDCPQFASEIVSGQPPPPLSPPGWYPDPERSDQQEYWDGSRWTGQRMPLKPGRKPLPWWLVTILALIATAAAAALVSAVLDGGHHEGMPETTGTVQLATPGQKATASMPR